MDNTKLNFTVINLLATAQLFHEELDELENTPYFKHSLKKAAKNIELELTKTLDDHIAHLWKMDPMKINDVSNYINQNKKT